MVFSPTGSASETSPVDPQAHADGNIVDVQLISTAAPILGIPLAVRFVGRDRLL